MTTQSTYTLSKSPSAEMQIHDRRHRRPHPQTRPPSCLLSRHLQVCQEFDRAEQVLELVVQHLPVIVNSADNTAGDVDESGVFARVGLGVGVTKQPVVVKL